MSTLPSSDDPAVPAASASAAEVPATAVPPVVVPGAGIPAAQFRQEVMRRRSFGIIAHPDAGKTTLTEKILLYSGCIEEAGAVRGRKSQRAARSDWMKMEQQRGISVTATCLCFDYQGYRLNLLDTPGHQDFSEDTYRTLNAVDAAVMVVDAVNGIESQTIKLFKICSERRIPILTFVNKMDRPGSDPLGVLTQIEEVLGIDAIPLNWPVGKGREFAGIVKRQTREVLKFLNIEKSSYATPFESASLDDPAQTLFPSSVMDEVRDEISLLDGAGVPFEVERFLRGEQTPVYFGSALTNYGVEQFLEGFVTLGPPPRPRPSDQGPVAPFDPFFTGVVFKIQANLDPRHRDRVAFVRVCSGRFERDMEVTIARSGERIRVPRSHQLFARDRETVEEAFPGDVIGIVNPGKLRLGDTLCGSRKMQIDGRWEYAPERFVRIRAHDTSKRKQFTRGLEQLIEEGAVQMLSDDGTSMHEPILAAVGELQFEVVQFRLESEYNVLTALDRLPYQVARWIDGPPVDPDTLTLPSGSRIMRDHFGTQMLLFGSEWSLDYFVQRHPKITLSEHRPET